MADETDEENDEMGCGRESDGRGRSSSSSSTKGSDDDDDEDEDEDDDENREGTAAGEGERDILASIARIAHVKWAAVSGLGKGVTSRRMSSHASRLVRVRKPD